MSTLSIRKTPAEAPQAELDPFMPTLPADFASWPDSRKASYWQELYLRERKAHMRSTEVTLGVGSGHGQLFVHGSMEAINRVQQIVLEHQRLRSKDLRPYNDYGRGNR